MMHSENIYVYVYWYQKWNMYVQNILGIVWRTLILHHNDVITHSIFLNFTYQSTKVISKRRIKYQSDVSNLVLKAHKRAEIHSREVTRELSRKMDNDLDKKRLPIGVSVRLEFCLLTDTQTDTHKHTNCSENIMDWNVECQIW